MKRIIVALLFLALIVFSASAASEYKTIEDLDGKNIGVQTAVLYEELIRDNPAQEGLTADWTRATFIVRKGHLEKLKDYAYTERLTLKEALDKALGAFLDDKNDLLPHR